jgi:hypothetical protein
MVAVSVFMVVIMYGTTALLNTNLLHRKSTNMRSIMDSLSFIMEDMSRNIRTGYDMRCFTGVGGDVYPVNFPYPNVKTSCEKGLALAFEPSAGSISNVNNQWVYSIGETNGVGKIYKATEGPYTNDKFIQMTPDEVDIDIAASGFSVLGANSFSGGDEQQPLVTIRLVGNITFKDVVTPFSLQTSVTQRLIDNY